MKSETVFNCDLPDDEADGVGDDVLAVADDVAATFTLSSFGFGFDDHVVVPWVRQEISGAIS